MKFPCIDHEKTCSGKGYANVRFNGRMVGYHRVVFFHAYGYLPDTVMHVCDNPRCINPLHLKAGSKSTNMRDMVTKGRHHQQKSVEVVSAIQHAEGSLDDVAAMFNVSRSYVHNVRRGRVTGRLLCR